MINPTKNDKQCFVMYRRTGEIGKIVSINEFYVFVRFDGRLLSKACRREDLEWVNEWMTEEELRHDT